MLDNPDNDGVTMRAAMRTAGLDPAGIDTLARDPSNLAGYVEVHIEQGPVLLDGGKPLGVVTSIAGSVRMLVTVEGLAGHAGTVPMALRRDAAAAAAEIVLAVEQRCNGQSGLVGTVGKLDVPNGAINVIPGRCELRIDIRAAGDAVRDGARCRRLRGDRTDRRSTRGYAPTCAASSRPHALHAAHAAQSWPRAITRTTVNRHRCICRAAPATTR